MNIRSVIKITRVLPLCFLCLSWLVSACASPPAQTGAGDAPETPSPYVITEKNEVISQASIYLPPGDNWDGLALAAEIVVIGTVTDTGDYYNGARKLDSNEADDTYFGMTRIYEIQVERYLKGRGAERFLVPYWVGSIHNVDRGDLQERIANEDWMPGRPPLEEGIPYLFFLARASMHRYPEVPPGDYYRDPDTWPWIWDLSDPEWPDPILSKAEMGVTLHFEHLTLDEAIERIRNPQPSATPRPTRTPREPYPIEILQLTSSPAPAVEPPLSTPYPVPMPGTASTPTTSSEQ